MRLEAVGKRYGVREPWIVRDVSADVSPGTLIRLEGRNGSGKSTLLRVAAGVSLPSKGKVTGRPHTGYVPERFPGALPFTGRDYLLHLARVHGLRSATVASRVDGWLERLGAAGYADRPLRGLSKGMCQKIAIAQALLPNPGLLVLDEAWTGLDQAARGALDAAALERVADGGTVIFVDHEQTRLQGKISQRWRFDGGGRVTMTPGDAGPAGEKPDARETVIIELDGLEPGAAARLAKIPGVEIPGVLSARGAIACVAAARSDDVLRQVLAWDGVHVVSVRAGQETGQ
jgi:ABC-2 type transport system ATP-binding protein